MGQNMNYPSPLSPHPPLHLTPIPDEAEIRARIQSIQEDQQQEVITTIFQHARSNISRSPIIPPPRTSPTAEPSRNASATLERNLHSKYPHNKNNNINKDGGAPPVVDHSKPPPEPVPTYTPKDLSGLIVNGTKHDAAYYVYEAVRGCQTKVKNITAMEKEYVVGGGVGGTKSEDGNGRMPAPVAGLKGEFDGVKEEQKRVQRNTLDVARDPRLQRR